MGSSGEFGGLSLIGCGEMRDGERCGVRGLIAGAEALFRPQRTNAVHPRVVIMLCPRRYPDDSQRR